jgi:hypothetical protein
VIEESASVLESPNIERAEQAFELRVQQARVQRAEPLPEHPANGDEDLYPEKAATGRRWSADGLWSSRLRSRRPLWPAENASC